MIQISPRQHTKYEIYATERNIITRLNNERNIDQLLDNMMFGL